MYQSCSVLAALVFLPLYANGSDVGVVMFFCGISPLGVSSLELVAVVFVHFRLTALAYHIKRQ